MKRLTQLGVHNPSIDVSKDVTDLIVNRVGGGFEITNDELQCPSLTEKCRLVRRIVEFPRIRSAEVRHELADQSHRIRVGLDRHADHFGAYVNRTV